MPRRATATTKRKRDEDDQAGCITPITSPSKAKRTRMSGGKYATTAEPVPSPKSPKKSPRSRRGQKYTDDGIEIVQEEKRQRPFRKHAPQTYLTKLMRATSQRMFVVKRERKETIEGLEESVQIVGTTGNIYKVVIGKLPSCSCPDAKKGNQCKHIVYVLCNVLKVKDYLQYQLAFLSSELREIFENAPLSPMDEASKDNDGKRKPIEGDCPICFMEFDAKKDELVWCKAACGNNIHKTCFQQWVTSLQGREVQCVYCRSPWEADSVDIRSLLENATVGDEGYINVGGAMGISRERDYSTYHPHWVRRQYYPYC